MPTELPPDHHRSISTTAQIVEKVLNEMEDLLRHANSHNVSAVITDTFSDEQRSQMLAQIHAIRKANQALFHEFNLKPTVQSEFQILQAQKAYLWTVLRDSKSKKLRGFGKLTPEIASVLDTHIDALLSLLDELRL
jgi:hypothetical protein